MEEEEWVVGEGIETRTIFIGWMEMDGDEDVSPLRSSWFNVYSRVVIISNSYRVDSIARDLPTHGQVLS